MGDLRAKLRARFSRANSSSAASIASVSDGEHGLPKNSQKAPSTASSTPAETPVKPENTAPNSAASSPATAHGNFGKAGGGGGGAVSKEATPVSPQEKPRAGNGAATRPQQTTSGFVATDDVRRTSTVSTTLESIHENAPTLKLTSPGQHDHDAAIDHDAGSPPDGSASTTAALARSHTAPTATPIDFTDPFHKPAADVNSPTSTVTSPLALKSAVGSLTRAAVSGSGPRRQSLIPRSQVPHFKNYLSLGSVNDESGSELDFLSDASQARMAPRKIWVKRPGGSATLVTVTEDDLVDDVRDLILRKYGNSLGRQFDAPDLTIRITPREQRQERQLGPEEPVCRTLDAYYPGGQTVDEALVIDVPLRRTTPKASPRAGLPHTVYFADETGRPSEAAADYFGPGALGVPLHHAHPGGGGHVLQQQPSAMAMVQSGHIPQIPSPGGTRSRHYKERPERPRLGRQHTSSPTIMGVGVAGGPALGVIGGAAAGGGVVGMGVAGAGGIVVAGASHGDHSQTAALGSVGPSTPSGLMPSGTVPPAQILAAGDATSGSPASVVLAGQGGAMSLLQNNQAAAALPSGVRRDGSPASVVVAGSGPPSHRSGGDTPPGRVASPRPGSAAGLITAGPNGGGAGGAGGVGGGGNGNTMAGPSSRTRRMRRGTAGASAAGDGHSSSHSGATGSAANKLQIGVPPINVLIVEDNIINLKLLEAFMKRLKVRWQTAMNGRDAVRKWKQGGFHLVLMDIQLPIMSGLEATREIRKLERANGIGVFSSTPSSSPGGLDADGMPREGGSDKLQNMDLFKSPVIIVALTASSLQSDRHEALAAGCNDFLTKPVNFLYLERKVMEWGCMQALIDFDGWRKWKSLTGKADDDDGDSKPGGGKGGGGGKKGKPTTASKSAAAAAASAGGTGTDGTGDATGSSSSTTGALPPKAKPSKKNRTSLSLTTSSLTGASPGPSSATAAANESTTQRAVANVA